jgi:hypothetical protein
MEKETEKKKISNYNRVTLRGVVGYHNYRPVKVIRTDKNPVIYFTLMYHDKMWINEKGENQYNKKYVKVFLPPNTYGEKIFRNLYSGRHIEVTGTISYHYNNFTNKEGRPQTFTELQMSNVTIEFIDQPVDRQINKIIEILEGKDLISNNKIECSVDEMKKAVKEYIKELSGYIVDKTSDKTSKEEDSANEENIEEDIEEQLLASGVPF